METRFGDRFWVKCWVGLALFSVAWVSGKGAEEPAWVARSNAHAQVLLTASAELNPEFAARIGVSGYDDKITDFSVGMSERIRRAYTQARDELRRREKTETDPLVLQDLQILIKTAEDRLESAALNERLVVPYSDIPQLIFFGQFSLLDDQVDAARHPAALVRLRRYTGLEPGTRPITELAKEQYLEKAGDAHRLPPFRGELESDLAALPSYLSGIRDLYVKHGLDKRDGAAAALDTLDRQLREYAEWIRTHVLPKSRTDSRLPKELYADNLKNVGLDISPEQLMAKAQLAYAEIRNEMQTLARLVAKEHGFSDPDYRAVIRELKKNQLAPGEVEEVYREAIRSIEEIIRREKIVTLPVRALKMRLASDAETASQPAPHFQPPPLIGGGEEQGVFVLTTKNPSAGGTAASFDDFTFRAGTWPLTTHEGRPGHDLQFAAMVERGVSLARSLFAFNSVNVEGWALYAEAEMKPYEPLDSQLISLQYRLMRTARAFLDPMINLGLIDRPRALEILRTEVGLSQGMAEQEVDRYTFRAPGQATAYFYGYIRLMELRARTELALGGKFDRQTFNDFVVGQGLLPPDLLAKTVQDVFVPQQLKK